MKKGVRGGPRGNKYNWNKSNNKPILIGLADSPAAPQIQKLSEFDLAKHVQVLKSNQIDETITQDERRELLDQTNPKFPLTNATIPTVQSSKSKKARKSLRELMDFEDKLQQKLK